MKKMISNIFIFLSPYLFYGLFIQYSLFTSDLSRYGVNAFSLIVCFIFYCICFLFLIFSLFIADKSKYSLMVRIIGTVESVILFLLPWLYLKMSSIPGFIAEHFLSHPLDFGVIYGNIVMLYLFSLYMYYRNMVKNQ